MLLKAFVTAALAYAALSPSAASAAPAKASAVTTASWLMIQTAKGYRFDGKTLTLLGINPDTVMFSDRPKRLVHHLRTEALLRVWDKGKNNFKSDPPNAGMTTLVAGQLKGIIVELANPRLRGSTLSYSVRILDGRLPPSGGASTLFIDPSDDAPSGGSGSEPSPEKLQEFSTCLQKAATPAEKQECQKILE